MEKHPICIPKTLRFCEKILGRNINEIYYLAGDSSVINSFETPHLSLKSNTNILYLI